RAEFERSLQRLSALHRLLDPTGPSRQDEEAGAGFNLAHTQAGYGAQFAEHPMPRAIRPMWEGSEDHPSLKDDIGEVITIARQLTATEDYSVPAATETFQRLRSLGLNKV